MQRGNELSARESCIIAKRSGSNVERALMRQRRFDPREESRNRASRARFSSSVPPAAVCWPQLSVDSAYRSVPTSVNRVSTEHRSYNCNPSLFFLYFILPSVSLLSRSTKYGLSLSFSLSSLFFAVGFCGDLARFLSFLPSFLLVFLFLRLSACFFLFIHAVSFFSLSLSLSLYLFLSTPFFPSARRAQSPWPFFLAVSARFQTSSSPGVCFAHSKLFAATRAPAPTSHRRKIPLVGSSPRKRRISDAFHCDLRNRIKPPRRRDNSTGNGRECGL